MVAASPVKFGAINHIDNFVVFVAAGEKNLAPTKLRIFYVGAGFIPPVIRNLFR
jgi:hypothetical protein